MKVKSKALKQEIKKLMNEGHSKRMSQDMIAKGFANGILRCSEVKPYNVPQAIQAIQCSTEAEDEGVK